MARSGRGPSPANGPPRRSSPTSSTGYWPGRTPRPKRGRSRSPPTPRSGSDAGTGRRPPPKVSSGCCGSTSSRSSGGGRWPACAGLTSNSGRRSATRAVDGPDAAPHAVVAVGLRRRGRTHLPQPGVWRAPAQGRQRRCRADDRNGGASRCRRDGGAHPDGRHRRGRDRSPSGRAVWPHGGPSGFPAPGAAGRPAAVVATHGTTGLRPTEVESEPPQRRLEPRRRRGPGRAPCGVRTWQRRRRVPHHESNAGVARPRLATTSAAP